MLQGQYGLFRSFQNWEGGVGGGRKITHDMCSLIKMGHFYVIVQQFTANGIHRMTA